MSPTEKVRELLAERYGEELMATLDVSGPAGHRARFLATMAAVQNWFIEHPEVPTPRTVMFGADVTDPVVVTELAATEGWRDPYPARGGEIQTHVAIAHGDVFVTVAVRAVRPEDEARAL